MRDEIVLAEQLLFYDPLCPTVSKICVMFHVSYSSYNYIFEKAWKKFPTFFDDLYNTFSSYNAVFYVSFIPLSTENFLL